MTTHETHKPINFDPTAYTFVGDFDNDPEPGSFIGTGGTWGVWDGDERHEVEGTNPLNAEYRYYTGLLRASESSRYMKDRGPQCDHCGARIRYVAVLRHTSGDCIAVGETCLSERVSLASKADFDSLRKASAEARAEHRIIGIRTEFFATYPDLEAILWPVPESFPDGYAKRVLGDMGRKLRRDGSLSERQVEFARKLVVEEAERSTAKAARDAEPKVPAPEGRIEITGEVVSVKLQESDFGSTYKMIVRDDRGFAVYCTVPSTLNVYERSYMGADGAQHTHSGGSIRDQLFGRRVKFTATLTRSDRDEGFAFGKRPAKAELLTEATAA